MTQNSTLSFQEIDDLYYARGDSRVLRKYLPENAKLLEAEASELILVYYEKGTKGGVRKSIRMLDVLNYVISKLRATGFHVFGKKMKMSQDDATILSRVLRQQANKLEALASTYRLMATALEVSKEDFLEIVKQNPQIKLDIENPFD